MNYSVMYGSLVVAIISLWVILYGVLSSIAAGTGLWIAFGILILASATRIYTRYLHYVKHVRHNDEHSSR